jgi:hypothetical protein
LGRFTGNPLVPGDGVALAAGEALRRVPAGLGREHLCELCYAWRASLADDGCESVDSIECEVVANAFAHTGFKTTDALSSNSSAGL